MSDQKKYTNKLVDSRVLVIGGSSGIGYGVAEGVLENGGIVTISSSNSDRVNSKVESLKKAYPSAASKIFGVVADLSNRDTVESQLERMFKETVKNMPDSKLDHVVYTAGDALAIIKLSDINMEKILAAGQIRFFAPLLAAKFLPTYLVSSPRSSYIITTGGIADKPTPNWAVIGSYAGGHTSMVQGLALELRPIRVNGVVPGAVDTELWKMPEEQKRKFMQSLESKLPVGKVGKVEDVVETYLGLLRDANADGCMYRTNGGSLVM